MRYAFFLSAALLIFLIFIAPVDAETLSFYQNGITQKDIDLVLKENPLSPDQNIRGTLLHRSDASSIHLVQIRIKETPHIHQTHDLFVVLKRSNGIVHIEAESISMQTGDAVFIPREVVHYFENTGSEVVVALAVFTPPYAGKDIIPVEESTEAPAAEILEHSWKLEEEWPKIGKTKYSWKATVKNHSDDPQKVSIYYYLVNEGGFPLARNTASKIIPPHETMEILSDSYVENGIISRIKNSRAVLKLRPQGK